MILRLYIYHSFVDHLLSNYTVSTTSEDRKFSLSLGVKRLALAYVTFNSQIQVYHNNGLERGIMLSSLVHWPGMREEAKQMLEELGVDNTYMKQLQKVYRSCLYGVQ